MIPPSCKRLAEVDFPITAVSRHAAQEKSIRHGHPSTLHLWWARRPLASSRAVLLALLLPERCALSLPPSAAGRYGVRWRRQPRRRSADDCRGHPHALPVRTPLPPAHPRRLRCRALDPTVRRQHPRRMGVRRTTGPLPRAGRAYSCGRRFQRRPGIWRPELRDDAMGRLVHGPAKGGVDGVRASNNSVYNKSGSPFIVTNQGGQRRLFALQVGCFP